MQGTPSADANVNRPIASHGRRKPDPALVVALVEMRLLELPTSSLRRMVLARMIDRLRS